MNKTPPNEGSTESSAIPVLLYHSVAEHENAGLPGYNATPDEFERQIDALVASGREVVDFAELGRRLRDRTATGDLASITFDDGYSDNLAACRRLSERGLPATVFITTGMTGLDNTMSHDQLRELDALPGIELGAHSVSHPHLDALSADDAHSEIERSREDLGEILGHPVSTFAYPHGAYSPTVLKIVREAAFDAVAAVKNALSHPSDDPLAIARWTIHSGVSIDEVTDVVNGRGAPIAWRGERLRTRAARIARRARHAAASRGGAA